MRGLAGTGFGGVRWLMGGKAKVQGKGEGVAVACHHRRMILDLAY